MLHILEGHDRRESPKARHVRGAAQPCGRWRSPPNRFTQRRRDPQRRREVKSSSPRFLHHRSDPQDSEESGRPLRRVSSGSFSHLLSSLHLCGSLRLCVKSWFFWSFVPLFVLSASPTSSSPRDPRRRDRAEAHRQHGQQAMAGDQEGVFGVGLEVASLTNQR